MTNYIIHGKRPGSNTEEPLYTKATTYVQASHIKRIIERDCKATECRVQVLDLSEKPDFINAINN